MSQQRFIRCKHCGLPHEADAAHCPATGKAIERETTRRRRAKSPPSAEDYRWAHKPDPWPKGPESEPDPDELERLVGSVIEGKYRVDALIGRGGMGAVYRAENLRIGKAVAIKVLHRGLARGGDAERRFLREARVAGSIGHPNIVEVFDLGHLEDGKPFQVMELLEGQSLAERVRTEGALPEREVLEIAEQVLSALEAAHDRGVVHRDLKPENVFLVEREGAIVAKLLDFGVSKSATDHSLAITLTGVVVGTPYYLAPEQARGESNVDHRADIWAMGVVLYESSTGVLPFNAPSYVELIQKIVDGKPLPPSRFQPRISPRMEAVIMRALDGDPRARYATASEMRRELRAAREASARSRIDQRFTPYELDGAGDVTIRSEPDVEDPTEVSESFIALNIAFKGKSES
jgi:eukaryotic-like serine/threonine-protein kinase